MQSPSLTETAGYARWRLASTIGGKLADAVGVVIAIKTLAPAEYGVIGSALGLMAVIGWVNLAPEDVLWRDYPGLRDRLAQHLGAFVWFWWLKLAAVAVLAGVFAVVIARGNWPVAAAVFAAAVGWQALTALTLVEVPLFAGLDSRAGAVLVLAVRGVWLALLVPNFWFQSLLYYLIALGTYAGVTVGMSFWQLRSRWGVRLGIGHREAWPIVWQAIVEFTLWLHLIGRTRIFLQRGLLAILSLAGLSLAVLGQITVAVNLVSFALILPGVLENVAAVRFAHQPASRRRQLTRFLGFGAAVAALQFAVAAGYGRWVLEALNVHPDVFVPFMVLLAGASVLAAAGPALAYAMCYRPMRLVFLRVYLPAAVGCAVGVWLVRHNVDTAMLIVAGFSAVTGLAVWATAWWGDSTPRD